MRPNRTVAATLLILGARISIAAEEWPNLDQLAEMPCPAGSEWRTDYFESFLYRIEGLTYGGKWGFGRGERNNVHGQNGLEMMLKKGEDSKSALD